jgi:hypothetical protein
MLILARTCFALSFRRNLTGLRAEGKNSPHKSVKRSRRRNRDATPPSDHQTLARFQQTLYT